MPIQTVAEGMASAQESVVSKKELITSVISSLKQQNLEGAADLYRRSKEDIGYELMNFVGRGELAKPLANVFLTAKDFYKAAQVFETLDMKKEAAENYEKAGAFDSAAEWYANIGELAMSAEMFERGGAHSRAAPLFEQSGKWLDAARNYANAGEHFLAGRAFAKGEDKKKALECFQRVQQDDPSYPEAVDLLGPILEEMGFAELAIQKYKEIIGDQQVTPENAPVFYRVARLQESSHQLEEAKQTYSKILEMNLGYEDVQERYRALREGVEPRGAASPSPAAPEGTSSGGLVILNEDMSFFERSVLFQDLTFDEIRSFLAAADKKSFKAGELLLREGGPFPGLVLLHHGTIAVGMKLDGKDIRLRKFGPGDHFGEMTVHGGKSSRVTAVAETDGDYVVIPGDRMRAFLERNPSLKAKLLKNMMAAMDVHLDQYKEAVQALWRRGRA
ncbi:MAG: cyclic nucleotide-binding domain-containing protein [Vicinamibacteria bacterium]